MFTKNKILFLILIFASVLRFWQIISNPPSLNWDEISHGYNAYSILQTGKDEWGVSFPIIFRAYGDYKLPVYIYTTAASISIFGMNEFAVRVPSVIAGILTVLFTYLLVFELFKSHISKKQIGLWSSLLMAISPWTLFISRGAFEANFALTLIVSGTYFFLHGLKKPKSFIVSSILFGLSVWTYNSARVFVPVFLIILIGVYFQELKKTVQQQRNVINIVFIILFLFFVPMFYQLMNPVGQARYNKVSILDEGAINEIEFARNSSSLSPTFNRFVNNRVTYFLHRVGSNWLSHYTSSYLFTNSGTQFQFSVPNNGLLYLFTVPFLFVGLIFLLKKRDKTSILILVWFLLGPIASSITREAPHVLRSITILPIPMIITALGITNFLQWITSKKYSVSFAPLLVPTILFFCGVSLAQYWIEYSTQYRNTYSWSWQYGYKEVVAYVKDHYNEYDAIIVTKKYGEPHEFFLFYQRWNPNTYRDDENLIRYPQSDWFWVDRFDKFWFVNDWQIKSQESNREFITEQNTIIDCSLIKCLLVTSPGTVPDDWKKIKTIDFLDKKPAFELYEN